MDDYKIALGALLDANAKGDIDKQLNAIKDLSVTISKATLSNDVINDIKRQLTQNGIDLKLVFGNTGQITNQAKQVGQQIGNNISQGVSSGVNKAKSELKSFSDLTNFSELNKKIHPLQIDPSELKNYQNILNSVKNTYSEFGQVKITNETFNNGILDKFKVNIEQVNGDLKETKSFMMSLTDDKDAFIFDGVIKGSESVVQHLDKTKNAINQTADAINNLQLNNKADKIQLSTDVTKLTTDYQKFGIVSQEVENNLKELKLAQEAVVNAKGTDRLATEIEKYNTKLAETKSSWKELSATQVSLNQRTSQMTTMQEWMRKNKNATKLVGDQVNKLIEECKTCDAVRFNGIKNEFKDLQVQTGKAGKLGSGFLEGLVTQGKKFAQWVGVSGFVTRLGMAVKDTGRNVIELDDALTNISYTMDVTKSQLEDIGNSSLETAINLKTSASNVLDAVKTYANATETAESILNKAKPTIMMSNVSGMDTQQTVDILQGTMEQFDLAEDKLMHISDVMQTVSANMPYDFAKGLRELSEGIQASGSVAKDAGYDLENYTALLGTLIAKTRQSGSELGRSLRTMFVRTTKASSSALANGEVTEEDLSNAEKALRRVGIEVRSDIDTFKSFDEIMGELYNKVDSLSEVDLSNIAYEVASTRQSVCLSI